MIKVIIKGKDKSENIKDILIDEVETRAECEKKEGFACFMHPKTEPKPAKTVKSEHLSGINFRSREEVKKANEKHLNDWISSCSPDEYDSVNDYIQGLSREQYLVLVHQPHFMRRIFDEVFE
jgi:hypothetical protein